MDNDLNWTNARALILTKACGSTAPKVLRDPLMWQNEPIVRATVTTYLVHAIDTDIRSDVVRVRERRNS